MENNVRVTAEFLKEMGLFFKANEYRDTYFNLKEKKQVYDVFGGEVYQDDSFELTLPTDDPDSFYITKDRIERLIYDMTFDKLQANLPEEIFDLYCEGDIRENDEDFPREIFHEMYWKSVFEAYVKVAEKMVERIKSEYGLSGKIYVYRRDCLLFASDQKEVVESEFKKAYRTLERTILILEAWYPELIFEAESIYKNIDTLKGMSFYGSIKTVALSGKLQTIREILKDEMSFKDIIYRYDKGKHIVKCGNRTIVWDYTYDKFQEIESDQREYDM